MDKMSKLWIKRDNIKFAVVSATLSQANKNIPANKIASELMPFCD